MSVKDEPRQQGGAFFVGILLGMLLTAVVVVSALLSLQQRGLTVRLATDQVASQVQEEIRAAVRKELPTVLGAVSEQLPRHVAAQTARQLSTTSVEVGGFRFPVPPDAVAQVQAGIEMAVQQGLRAAALQADLDAVADRVGDQVFPLIAQRLNAALHEHPLSMELWPGFSLPVIVVAQ
jgi:hypothetical protein